MGVNADAKGEIELDFGLKAELPNTAKLTADITNPGASVAQGFDGALTPLFNVEHLETNLTLSAYAGPKISWGITVAEIAKFQASMSLNLPQLSATFGAEYCKPCHPSSECSYHLALLRCDSIPTIHPFFVQSNKSLTWEFPSASTPRSLYPKSRLLENRRQTQQ